MNKKKHFGTKPLILKNLYFFFKFRELCQSFKEAVDENPAVALFILCKEFLPIGGMVVRMIHKQNFTTEAICNYFTLPDGTQDLQMVEVLNDVLSVRLDHSYFPKVKLHNNSNILFRVLRK